MGAWHSLYFTVQKTKWARCWIPVLLGQWKDPGCLCQLQKQTPLWDPCMQQATAHWLLAVPTPPDGGLITGPACSSHPSARSFCLDTMHIAKLCLSLYWTVTLLFAWSICLPHSLILFAKFVSWHSLFPSMLIVLKHYRNPMRNSRIDPVMLCCPVFSREAQLQEIRVTICGWWCWAWIPVPDKINWRW